MQDSSSALLVAGSFLMSDNTLAYVARYDFDNSSWTALGTGTGDNSLPGPATAVAADNANVNSVFASGM